MPSLFGPDFKYDLVLPPSRNASGVVHSVTAIGRKKAFDFDNRDRVFTLVGDQTRYMLGYSTYCDAPIRSGDQIKFSVSQEGRGDQVRDFTSQGCLCAHGVTITQRAWWRLLF